MRHVSAFGQVAAARQARSSVLDRLLGDEELDPIGGGVLALRQAVHRDLESLLNARRPWRTPSSQHNHLRLSSYGYGLSDFTSGVLHHQGAQEMLRRDVETTIRRMEPRLTQVHVHLAEKPDRLRSVIRLRIEAMLQVQPVTVPVSFDTVIDVSTSETVLQLRDGA